MMENALLLSGKTEICIVPKRTVTEVPDFRKILKYLVVGGIAGSVAAVISARILRSSEEAIKLLQIEKSKKEEQASYHYK